MVQFAPFSMLRRIGPGVLACVVVALAAFSLQELQRELFHRVWLEGVALSILLGAGLRSVWGAREDWREGVRFAAKPLLEVAVMLLGAGVGLKVLAALQPAFLAGIVAVVAVAIGVSYGLCRLMGLERRTAVLVACGNSICGNSAIAAIAPIIDAKGEDVGVTIAFTAVMGVLAVLVLPLFGHALSMGAGQYGAFAGLTVYAVPQVLAATAPMGAGAIQMGTVVKLCRVMTLGPVSVALSLASSRGEAGEGVVARMRHVVPWFIVGFAGLVAFRAFGLLPPVAVAVSGQAAGILTVVSMAALGLETDLGAVVKAGPRVATAAVASLMILALLAYGLIQVLHLA